MAGDGDGSCFARGADILEDVFSDDPDNPDTEDGEENDDDLFSEIAKGVGEFVGEFVEGAESLGAELTEAQQNLQEALTGITGQDVFDAAGNAVGFVAETGVYFSNVTGLDGQTIYDAGKNVVGTIAKAAKDGVDEQVRSAHHMRTVCYIVINNVWVGVLVPCSYR